MKPEVARTILKTTIPPETILNATVIYNHHAIKKVELQELARQGVTVAMLDREIEQGSTILSKTTDLEESPLSPYSFHVREMIAAGLEYGQERGRSQAA